MNQYDTINLNVNGNQIKFNSLNNIWLFYCINNSNYNGTNDLTLAGYNNGVYSPLFQFFQNGSMKINNGSLTTQGITNNSTLSQTGAATFNGITNNTTLTQTGAATFNGITNNSTLTQNSSASFNNNTYFSNTATFGLTVFNNIATYYSRIGFLNIDTPIQIDNGKNNYVFNAYYSNSINDSNNLGIDRKSVV